MSHVVKHNPRLPTPSLRKHYYQCNHPENDAEQGVGEAEGVHAAGIVLSKSVSLPSLVKKEVQVLTLNESGEATEELHHAPTLPPSLLSHTRLGSSFTRRKALPSRDGRGRVRSMSSTYRDPRAVTKARSSLDKLATLAKRWEQGIKGPEVTLTVSLPHRRMRGIDVLYGAHQTNALPQHTLEEEEEDDSPTQDSVRAPNVKIAANNRKVSVLHNTPYFQTLESANPGLIKKLCKATDFTTQVAGQVIFRQDDRPGNCYVIVSGRVAVKIQKDRQHRPPSPLRDKKPSRFPTMTPMLASSDVRRSWIKVKEADDEEEWTEVERVQQKCSPRYVTLEGWSSWNPQETNLGTQVVALGAGNIFGELALQNDKLRAASIECLEQCEFLVINRSGYRTILREITDASGAMFSAVECLQKVKFFQQMEEQSAGLIMRLSTGVTPKEFPAGQVIFRQQDPPGSCYVIRSGEADVHIVPKEELPSEGEKVRRKRMATPRTCRDFDLARCITMVYAKKLPGNDHDKKERAQKDFRWLSFEGSSSFSQESRLGDVMATLKEGACFGELALQNSQPRAATIRCKTDCSMYVISKENYHKVLGEIMAKINFFDSNLPGIHDMRYKQSHPSILFQFKSFPEGHKFLHEGIIAKEPAVFLLKSGTVEFRRYMTSSENPAYVLSNTPLQENSWKSSCARPLTGVAGSRHKSAGRGTPSSPNSRQRALNMGGQVTWDVMEEQGLWCSLAFFPLNAVEPFTVEAMTPVEAYVCSASTARSLPTDLLLHMRTNLLRQMKGRTRQLPEDVLGNSGALALFNSSTASFGNDAYSSFRSSFYSNLGTTAESLATLGNFNLKSSAGNTGVLPRRPSLAKLNAGEVSPRPQSSMRVTFSDMPMARGR